MFYRKVDSMRLVNLTPHPIVLRSATLGTRYTIAPTLPTPRAGEVRDRTDEINVEVLPTDDKPAGFQFPVTVNNLRLGRVENLPDPRPGVLLIVSRVIAEALPDRTDLVIPDEMIRDDQGRIVGCRALARVN